MELMVVQIFVETGILCGILYMIARWEADYSFAKVAMVVAATSLGCLVIAGLLQDNPIWLSLIVTFAFVSFMLMTFCWISLSKSIFVVIVYFIVHLGLQAAVAMIGAYFAQGMAAPSHRSEEAFRDVVEGMYDMEAEEFLGMTPEEVIATKSNEKKAAPKKPAKKPAKKPNIKKPGAQNKSSGKKSGNLIRAEKTLRIGKPFRNKKGRYVVNINGDERTVGDKISSVYKNVTYTWKVKRISQAGVDLQYLE